MANYILVVPGDPTWGCWKLLKLPERQPRPQGAFRWLWRWGAGKSALGTRLPERVTFKILSKPQPT